VGKLFREATKEKTREQWRKAFEVALSKNNNTIRRLKRKSFIKFSKENKEIKDTSLGKDQTNGFKHCKRLVDCAWRIRRKFYRHYDTITNSPGKQETEKT
jgi:molecular chaperone DnaK (HSP70)